jgi:hypothetical protein
LNLITHLWEPFDLSFEFLTALLSEIAFSTPSEFYLRFASELRAIVCRWEGARGRNGLLFRWDMGSWLLQNIGRPICTARLRDSSLSGVESAKLGTFPAAVGSDFPGKLFRAAVNPFIAFHLFSLILLLFVLRCGLVRGRENILCGVSKRAIRAPKNDHDAVAIAWANTFTSGGASKVHALCTSLAFSGVLKGITNGVVMLKA